MSAVRKKKKSILLRVVLLGVFVSIIITLVQLQVDIRKSEQELLRVQEQIKGQELQNQELHELLESGDDAAYMERLAREKFGYVRPEERVYIASAGN